MTHFYYKNREDEKSSYKFKSYQVCIIYQLKNENIFWANHKACLREY